jgi:hypothetical protein
LCILETLVVVITKIGLILTSFSNRKISEERKRISVIKKQLERIKILRELQKLEDEEKTKIGEEKEKESSLSGILKLSEIGIGETIDRFSNMFGFNSNDHDHGYSGEINFLKVFLTSTKFIKHFFQNIPKKLRRTNWWSSD